MEEAIRNDDFCYEQSKKRESLPNFNTKKISHFDKRRRGFKSNKNFGSKSHNLSKNNYQKMDFKNKVPQSSVASKGRDMPNNFVKNTEQRVLDFYCLSYIILGYYLR